MQQNIAKYFGVKNNDEKFTEKAKKKQPLSRSNIPSSTDMKTEETIRHLQVLVNDNNINDEEGFIDKVSPDCLKGLQFVITGLPTHVTTKEKLITLINKYGGSVKMNLSTNINYIIAGKMPNERLLESGNNMQCKILDDIGFLELMLHLSLSYNLLKKGSVDDGGTLTATEAATMSTTEIYKAKSSRQLIGQQGEDSSVNKLGQWLTNWTTIRNKVNQRNFKRSSSCAAVGKVPGAKSKNYKACLLHGPPGIGKTTSVQILCDEMNLELIQVNASETNRKKELKELFANFSASSLSMTDFITTTAKEINKNKGKNKVLLLDEVDGISHSHETEALQEIIKFIKNTNQPVILICNNRSNMAMSTLAEVTYEIEYRKPSVQCISKSMKHICKSKNINITDYELNNIITSTNGDIRQTINELTMLHFHSSSSSSSAINNGINKNKSKDIRLTNWDNTRTILSGELNKRMSLNDREQLFYNDSSKMGLFIHENYLTSKPHGSKNYIQTLARIGDSADAISMGDITETAIRTTQEYALLPVQAAFSALIPGVLMSGTFAGSMRYPQYFDNATKNTNFISKLDELRKSLHATNWTAKTRNDYNMEILQPLSHTIVRLLLKKNTGMAQNLLKQHQITGYVVHF